MDQVVLRIRLGGIRRETSWYERKPTGAMGILVRAKKIILSLWTCSLALNAYKPVDILETSALERYWMVILLYALKSGRISLFFIESSWALCRKTLVLAGES